MKLVKAAWRLLVGVKDALALLFLLLFFGVTFTLLSASPNPGAARGGALLLDLDGVIVEQPEAADPLAILSGNAPSFAQFRARDVIHALRTAAKDDDIKTVVLNLDSFVGGGQVVLQDVADAIDAVRAAKKPVLAYATGYSDDAYLLASHASEIWLNPMGGVLFTGPGGSQPYYKGLVDRLGVNVHVYRVGKFKSFVEPYTRAGQSDESRAANQALAGALWEDWQGHVRKARPQADFAAILADPAATAQGQGLTALALSRKLVDTLADETAFGARVAKLAGGDDDKAPGNFNHSDLDAYIAANPPESGGSGVGIVTVAGTIVDGSAPAGTAGGDSISALIHKAARDEDIKALVVRVDSPGGSAMASEQIRLAMEEVRKAKKPLIISMANVAASGGYWIAMGGDRIFAEPATITGSIGVFGIFPTFENTLSRYGVTADGVKTTPLSGQPDIIAGTTPETDGVFQAGVEDIYRRFLSLVSGARKLPVTRVDEIAQGRVWDGGAARQLGLIDAFGSLDDAVAEAAKRAKIDADDISRVWIEEEPDFLSEMIAGFTAQASTSPAPDIISQMVRRQQAMLTASLRDSAQIITGPAVQVRCLACPATPSAMRRADTPTALFNRIFS